LRNERAGLGEKAAVGMDKDGRDSTGVGFEVKESGAGYGKCKG